MRKFNKSKKTAIHHIEMYTLLKAYYTYRRSLKNIFAIGKIPFMKQQTN